jgi:hypothetical protein
MTSLSPKDLPLTADATEIEYDDFFESIEFKSQSDVKTVVAFLTGELEKRKWARGPCRSRPRIFRPDEIHPAKILTGYRRTCGGRWK